MGILKELFSEPYVTKDLKGDLGLKEGEAVAAPEEVSWSVAKGAPRSCLKRPVKAVAKDFSESDHPRGQPGNAGQFGPGGAGGPKAPEAGKPDNNLPGKGSPDLSEGIKAAEAIEHEKTSPVPKGTTEYDPDPAKSTRKDGVADSARVGVPGDEVPPPPARIGRMPNLTEHERQVEDRFASAYEKDPDGMATEYMDMVHAGKVGDAPNIFNTDDAKVLSPDYNPYGVSRDEALDAKSMYNVCVHQTANAVAKRAFVQHLDWMMKALPKDQHTVLVTSGGCAGGKGYSIANVDQAKSLAGKAGAIWDAAGEQNATENPWVLQECKKRGIRPAFMFVNADPKETWENPERGVVERAGKKGRMIASNLFADSYALGAQNFHKFMEAHKGEADFMVLDNSSGKPRLVDAVPKEALALKSEDVRKRAESVLEERASNLKPAVLRGGLIGKRIWKEGNAT
jgi:hypothetical protein